jgi:hypothetical protein
MQACDHGKTASGFIHGFRYNVRFLAKALRAGGARPPTPPTRPTPSGWRGSCWPGSTGPTPCSSSPTGS